MFIHVLALVIFILFFISFFILLKKIYSRYKNKKYNPQKNDLKKEKEFYSGLIKINAQTAKQGVSDSLLSSRLIFEDRLNHIIHHCERYETCFCLMMLEVDLSDLKITFNDNQQNRFFMDMLARLKKNIRKIDTVIHFHNNVFLILLPKWYEPKTISYIAQRIQDNMITPWIQDEKAWVIHTYMGIVIYPDDGVELNELLEHVTIATQQAKLKGKDTAHFYQQAIQKICDDDLKIASWLSHKTFRDSFFVKYHTYVNMKTTQIEYIDVIPCMRHPELGSIQLMKYPHALERSGQLIDMIEQLLIDSIKQWQRWQQDSPQIKGIIIPLTMNQLLNRELLYKLSYIMKNYPISEERFIFELILTDHSFNFSSLGKILPLLNELAIKISINIFYFSQFSIEKISKFPIQLLKIDKDILKDLIANENNVDILTMIISLTQKLHIDLIADDVRSKKEIRILQKLGCNILHFDMINSKVPLEQDTHRIEL